jgi:hypothetical protein
VFQRKKLICADILMTTLPEKKLTNLLGAQIKNLSQPGGMKIYPPKKINSSRNKKRKQILQPRKEFITRPSSSQVKK